MASTSDVVALAVLVVGLSAWQGVAAQQACNGGASSLPSGRFHDNGDGTVTDAESKEGLAILDEVFAVVDQHYTGA